MNSDDVQPGFWKRLGRSILWILKATLLTFVFIGVIGGLAWGGFLGVKELRRSFDVVSGRIDANQEKIYELQGEISGLERGNPGQQQQIDTLQTEIDDLDARLASLKEDIAADLERQQQVLSTLEESVATAASNNETVAEDTAALGDALVALQGDVNENGLRIDDLGGEIDAARAEIATLDTGLSTLLDTAVSTAEEGSATTTEMAAIREVLALFRVWELISRARLRLVENNPGLATADVELALRVMDTLVTAAPEDSAESWQLVQTRLALAYANLPDNPALAAADLDSAWDELDKVLAARVSLAGAAAEEATPTP